MMATTVSPGVTLLPSLFQLLPFIILFGIVFFLVTRNSSTNALIRFLWFVFIGWWLGLLWFLMCLALVFSIIFFPIGIWGMTKTWKVMTLSGAETPSDAVEDVSVEVNNRVKQQVEQGSSKESEEDSFEKLEKLKDLRDNDVISEKEFEDKKDDLMDDI